MNILNYLHLFSQNWEFQRYGNNRTNSYVKDGVLYIKPVNHCFLSDSRYICIEMAIFFATWQTGINQYSLPHIVNMYNRNCFRHTNFWELPGNFHDVLLFTLNTTSFPHVLHVCMDFHRLWPSTNLQSQDSWSLHDGIYGVSKTFSELLFLK